MPQSRLGEELRALWDRGMGEALDHAAQAKAREQVLDLLAKLQLSLKRNRLGLDVLDPVLLQSFAHWDVTPETKVTCLLPVVLNKLKVIQKDAGHVALKLPPLPKPVVDPAQSQPQPSSQKPLQPSPLGHKNIHISHKKDLQTSTQKDIQALPSTQKDVPSSTQKDISSSKQKNVQPSPSAQNDPGLQADIRTKDGLHVSPRKLNTVVAKLVNSALLKHGLPKDKIQCTLSGSELGVWVKLDCGWTAELLPCVAAPRTSVDTDVYYVSRRFTCETYTKNDSTWRPCSAVRDHDVIRSISCTDQGLRMRSMHLVTRLLKRDWRLDFITCYDVQTALLHDMDFHVDYSPRWQRCTLESCVQSLLKTMQYFVDRESMPHFDLNRFNLWQHATPKQMTQARNALNRLLSNEKALISLAKRASTDSCVVSMEFGPS